MKTTESGITIDVRPDSWKADLPMEVTLLGMVIWVNDVQSRKVFVLMVVRPEGRVTEARLLQSEKAFTPMEVTESGTTIEVRREA